MPLSELESRVLTLVATDTATSRAAISRSTGAVRSTISRHVSRLIERGLLQEGAADPGPRGRPATRLEIGPRIGRGLVISVEVPGITLAVTDVRGEVQCTISRPESFLDDPVEALAAADDMAGTLLAEAGLTRSDLQAILLVLPAPVNAEGRPLPFRRLFPAWAHVPVREQLGATFGADVMVENDSNVMAIGAMRRHGDEALPLLYLHLSSGVGAGIIDSGGRLFRGADGAAGDVGHLRLHGVAAEDCPCGRRGCVAASIALPAVLRRAGVLGAGDDLGTALGRMRRPEVVADPEVSEILRTAGDEAGLLASTLIDAFNPRTLVVGGDLVHLGETVLSALRSRVYDEALSTATYGLRILPAGPDEDLALSGGARLLQSRILGGEGPGHGSGGGDGRVPA